MKPQARDASSDADAKMFERYRVMTPDEKLQGLFNMLDFVEQMALIGIREQFPSATPSEVQDRFAERWYSPAALELYRRFRKGS